MKKWILGLAIISLIWACGGSGDNSGDNSGTTGTTDKKVSDAGDVSDVNGKAIYKMSCVACHMADGSGGINGAKNLAESTLDLDGRIDMIKNGSEVNPTMVAFSGMLSPKEIKAVALYTMEFK